MVLEQKENLKTKRKFYYVVNEFEHKIDDYEKDIYNVSKDYFGTKAGKKPDILSRAFYKLWEMILMFDLIDLNSKKFVSAHLAEGPGSFIQATMFYREKFSSHYKKDTSQGSTREFIGSYDFVLDKTKDGWRLNSFKFNLKYMRGNLELE